MDNPPACSVNSHEKDPLDNFCITCHIELIETKQQDYDYCYDLSYQLDKLNQQNEALVYLERGIKFNLKLHDICNKIGDGLRRLLKDEEALFHFQRGQKIKKQNLELWKLKSDILNKLQRFEEALICQNVISDCNLNKESLAKAYILQRLNQHDEALKEYNDFLEQSNENKDQVLSNKGVALSRKQNFAEALQCFEEALQINPQHTHALQGKGTTLLKLKKYDEALKCFDAALQINPQFAEALNGKGNTLKELRNYEEALSCYDKAILLNPLNYQFLQNKGKSFEFKDSKYFNQLQNFIKIQQPFNLILNKHQFTLTKHQNQIPLMKTQKKQQVYQILIQDHINSIKKKKMTQLNEKIMNLKTQYEEKSISQGMKLIKQSKFNEALNMFDQILIEKQNPEAIYYKALALFHLNRFEEALTNCDISESLGVHPQETKELMDKIIGKMIVHQ